MRSWYEQELRARRQEPNRAFAGGMWWDLDSHLDQIPDDVYFGDTPVQKVRGVLARAFFVQGEGLDFEAYAQALAFVRDRQMSERDIRRLIEKAGGDPYVAFGMF